jgi:dihydroorotate dehydrogenase electron transfer subunit
VASPVLRVVEHGPETRSLVFPAPFSAQPGQFLMVWLPGIGEKPFSLSELHGGELEITVKAVGPVSRALAALQPGQRVGLRGPYGSAFQVEGPAVLLGGGIGAAPLRFLARSLARQGHPARVLLGARTAAEHIFVAEFARLGARFATDDGSLGRRGFVTDLLLDLPLSADTTLCACGPEPMLRAVRRLAEDLDLPVQLSLERVMKCGLGLCGACCLEGSGVRCCVEGPVVEGESVREVPAAGSRAGA